MKIYKLFHGNEYELGNINYYDEKLVQEACLKDDYADGYIIFVYQEQRTKLSLTSNN